MTYRQAYDDLIVKAIALRDSEYSDATRERMKRAIEIMESARDSIPSVVADTEYVPL